MDSFELTRLLLQRSLSFVYLIAFLVAANQVLPLIGSQGLQPVRRFLERVRFRDAPSLFWVTHSDAALVTVSWVGVILAAVALTGIVDHDPFLTFAVWALLWVLYLSLVNVGQTFYGFGWESILLETGFLAIFLGPTTIETPVVVIFLMRWVLFRVMFGAGLIKLRGDSCWRDLTCMYYHYETQPLPNPLSLYFHRLPKVIHRWSVWFNHFVELVVPFGFFLPAPLSTCAGILTIIFQLILIFSGNLSWLNYLTIVLCFSCFGDSFLRSFMALELQPAPMGAVYWTVIALLTVMILLLSVRPARNLFARRQVMNRAYDSLHLVNTYGAFGSITRKRFEIIVEGCADPFPNGEAVWKEYEFKGKPGNVMRRPCIVSPYHYRLDWQMWFAAMSSYHYNPWFVTLVFKMLQGDRKILGLLAGNPFPDAPPQYIRATLYYYAFVPSGDKTGAWWNRTLVREYLPAVSLEDFGG